MQPNCFRYNATGQWFKGNTHIHSTASDGGKTFVELADMYAGAGYDFLFRTDHRVASDVQADETDYPLLWLDGIELNGFDERGSGYHIVVLGRVTGVDDGMPLPEALDASSTPGNLVILAHPTWTGNTFEDVLTKRCHGVEVYNHVCRWLNGRCDGRAYWSAMLDRNPDTLGLACDDAHLSSRHITWNGGWIVANAPCCTREAIMQAIRCGNFYSSRGPGFHSLVLENERTLRAHTSPISMARLVGPRNLGQQCGDPDGPPLTEVRFDIPDDWAYAYLEIEDAAGRRAWTNTLFVASD